MVDTFRTSLLKPSNIFRIVPEKLPFWRNCFFSHQRQSATPDKLIQSASPCYVSHSSVPAAVSFNLASSLLYAFPPHFQLPHSFCLPMATSLSNPRICPHPRRHQKKKKEFDPVSFSSYVTVDEGAIGK